MMEHNDEVIFEILSALAGVDDKEPSDIEYDLSEYINPIAVGNLFVTPGVYWELSFEVPRHVVTVTHTGEVFIDGTRQRDIEVDSPGHQ